MPFIKSSTFKRYTLLAISISFNREIISLYSRYTKRGLVYIIIIFLFSRQPSSYSKYTKANTYLLYNMRLVPFNKYIFLYYYMHLYIHYSFLIP